MKPGEQMQPEPSQTTSEDEELERRIIGAFVHPQPDLLKQLYQESTSVKAVNARAVGLGLTTALIRNSRLTGVLPEMRVCIQCDARFLSAGPHNRRCKRCLAR